MDDYDSLCASKDRAERDKTACENRISDLESKIERLKKQKTVISNQKSAFKTLKKEDKNTVEATYTWRGDNYDSFKIKGAEMKGENEYFYKYSLDAVLDAINNEITRLENLCLEEYGLLGRLVSKINSLLNSIENFFN